MAVHLDDYVMLYSKQNQKQNGALDSKLVIRARYLIKGEKIYLGDELEE